MDVSRAFSPGHVTGFFSIHPHTDPLRHGSTGAGFSLAEGVTTTIQAASDDLVLLNGERIETNSVSAAVLRLFRQRTATTRAWNVTHETLLPVGCGFGTSGAGALSLALALNEAEGFPLGHLEAAALAHCAELEMGTGLGTVLGEVYGGFEVRTVAGAPGLGRVENLAYSDDLRAVFLVFGARETPELLANPEVRLAVSREGETLRQRLLDDPTVAQFLRLSVDFGHKAGLVSDRLQGLQKQFADRGIVAPMLMFGDGLFTLVENSTFDAVQDLFRTLAPLARVFGTSLDYQGGRTLVRH